MHTADGERVSRFRRGPRTPRSPRAGAAGRRAGPARPRRGGHRVGPRRPQVHRPPGRHRPQVRPPSHHPDLHRVRQPARRLLPRPGPRQPARAHRRGAARAGQLRHGAGQPARRSSPRARTSWPGGWSRPTAIRWAGRSPSPSAKHSATVAPAGTGPVENPATASLYNIARYLAYLAVALVLGTAAFVALCRPTDRGPLRRPLVAGWWTLLAATLALLVLRAPYETGTGPATAFDASAFTRTLTGRPGLALLARIALLLIAAVVAPYDCGGTRGPAAPAAGRRCPLRRGSRPHLGRRRARLRGHPGAGGDGVHGAAPAGDGRLAGRPHGPADLAPPHRRSPRPPWPASPASPSRP